MDSLDGLAQEPRNGERAHLGPAGLGRQRGRVGGDHLVDIGTHDAFAPEIPQHGMGNAGIDPARPVVLESLRGRTKGSGRFGHVIHDDGVPTFHFPDDEGYRLRYLLTDLQRVIRRMTEALAEERGRPFYLAARVSGSLEMCRRIGYDIPTWIDEGLVDILIPAGNAVTDASIDVAGFARLCEGTDVLLYPGFDSNLPDPFVGPEDQDEKDHLRTRAISSRYHRAGASGIYAFNWHANRDSKRPLLTTIGSAESLAGTDKIYAATHRFIQREGAWRGAYRIDRIYGEVPVELVRTLTDEGPTVTLVIAEDFDAHKPTVLQLRLRLNEWVEGDTVLTWWDGERLGEPVIDYCKLENPSPPGGAFQPLPRWRDISEVSSAVWLSWDFTESGLSPGAHAVRVALRERNPRIAAALTLTDVEFVVRY